ncbi:hypothetical protein BJX99DRAFT_228113 [Aspergillus californicus]
MESLSRPGRMAIDSLLNPPTESDQPASKLHYAPLTPTYSPLYPPSPNQYYYSLPDSQHHQHHHHHHHHHHHPSPQESHHHHSFMPYRPRSTDSSPDTYRRDRYDSVSSTSSTNNTSTASNQGERRRAPRPKYEEEEMYFIWYHRVDLSQEWKEVRECFNRQFPARPRSGFQGIQCKFYRFIKEKKCPTLREQRRMRDGEFMRQEEEETRSRSSFNGGAPQFGVIEWMGVWYPWMREDREEVMRRRLSR